MRKAQRTVARMRSGQSTVELALLLALVALVAIAVLSALGPAIADALGQVLETPTPVDQRTPVELILADFRQRMLDYYSSRDRWPRSWGDYRFTDIGLDPADWSEPVEGVVWNPNGSRIGLANVAGDAIQLYVTDLNGNRLQVYDGWSIWCPVLEEVCYYHTIAPGNEVDLRSLEVVTR